MTKKILTLTIVIPAYNEENHIAACLRAIAAQTIEPDEVIVVDNNSADRTAQVVQSFSFARLLKEPRQGIVYARNRGFDAARGDLICRIDADTLLPRDWVSKVKKIHRQAGSPAYLAATAPADFRNHGPKILWFGLHRLTYFWFGYLLLGHHTLYGANMFITRKLWRKIHAEICLDNSLHEDMDLAFHARRAGAEVRFIPEMKNSVLARQMFRKSFYYPLMMLRQRFSHVEPDRPAQLVVNN